MSDDQGGPLWGVQTESARRHFAIGPALMPFELICAIVDIKAAAARANAQLGRLDPVLAQAIEAAVGDVRAGRHDDAFPLSPWQSGSGTQTHMNVNEVLARLAQARVPAGHRVHPNDDVNRGQSSNDVIPAAIHVAAALSVRQNLLPAIDTLAATLRAQSMRFTGLVKLGRTHLQDAVPLTLGQEIGAWLSQVLAARQAIDSALPALLALPLGGTAVGSGLNTHPHFAVVVCRELAAATGVPFTPTADRFAAIAGHEAVVILHGALKSLAVALNKLANDVRLLASGPHGGIGELVLPANEPGSSIMPGKVNPTQCEMLAMVCCQVIANDVAVTLGAAGGQLQLNTYRPLVAVNLLQSLQLLADAMRSFEVHALRGLGADEARIGGFLRASLMSVTALAPHIGHDCAALIAATARDQRITLRDAALALGIDSADFDRWTDPVQLLGLS
jgi:fumarate hydratase, class II